MSDQTPLSERDEDDIRDELCHAVANATGAETTFENVDAEVAPVSDRKDGLVGQVRPPAGVKLLVNPHYDIAAMYRSPLEEQLAYEGWVAGEITLHEDGGVSITVWEQRFSD